MHFEQLASSLLQVTYCISHDEKVKDVVDYLHKHANVHSIPVVQNNVPVGMIIRGDVLELFSTSFGRSLNERKNVSEIMMRTPVIVESDKRLDEVAQLVTLEHDDKLLWHFIITDKGQYIGTGSVRDLLRQLTQQQLQHARYANPLTLLPGNVPIYQEVEKLILHKKQFSMAYFDLNNFKPFNDIYGYAKGDKIIQLVASLMQAHCQSNDFIGHIGGDDFVAIYQPENCIESCKKIVSEFDEKVKSFYNEKDLKAGGIQANSRTGQLQFFPLLSLAIGVVEPDLSRCRSHHDIAELASAAKKQAKLRTDSSVFVSRRAGPTI